LKTVRELYPVKPNKERARNYIKKLSAMPYNINTCALIAANDMPLLDSADTLTIGKVVVPKDNYSDGLRVYYWAHECLGQVTARNGLSIPSIGNHLDEWAPATQWTFKKAYDSTIGKVPKRVAGDNAAPHLWGGAFETSIDDWMDEDGENVRKLDIARPHYYNVYMPKRDVTLFKSANPTFAFVECSCAVLKTAHVHAVSSHYASTFRKDEEIIQIAPPLHFIKELADVKLEIKQSATYAHRIGELNARVAAETARSRVAAPAAASVDEESDDDQDYGQDGSADGQQIEFGSAEEAFKALCSVNTLDYLQTVRRKDTNIIAWQTLAAPSKSGAKNEKAKLNAVYNGVMGQMCTGAYDLRDILCELRNKMKLQAMSSTTKQWSYVGWCIGRLGAGDAKIAQLGDRKIVRST
jgi:hypothetical protein